MTRHDRNLTEDGLDALEDGADRARRDVARALDALYRRFPEGGRVEDMLDTLAQEAGSAARGAADVARRNPGPAALLGAGALWLSYEALSRRDAEARPARRRREGRVEDEIADAEARLDALRGELNERSRRAGAAAGDAVAGSREALRDGADRAAEAFERGARTAGREALGAAGSVRDEAQDMVASRPLTSAVLAFAAGAAMMGALRDR